MNCWPLAQDVSFTLDQLAALNQADPRGTLAGKLDLQRVGVFMWITRDVASMRLERQRAGGLVGGGERISLGAAGTPVGSRRSD